jgi:hypothetical protein
MVLEALCFDKLATGFMRWDETGMVQHLLVTDTILGLNSAAEEGHPRATRLLEKVAILSA